MRVALRVPSVYEMRDASALTAWGVAHAAPGDVVFNANVVYEYFPVRIVTNVRC